MFANGLISKSDFYSKLLERSECFVETIDDKERNRDVLKHNLNVLIDLCHKRLAISDDHNNDSDESSLNEGESEQTLEKSIERAKKWLIRIKNDKRLGFKCIFNDCQSRTIFSKKYEALAHVWGHTGDRPYKCGESGCDYSGRRKSHLTEHSLTHREETYKCRPYKCCESGCDYGGRTERQLREHMMSHTGEKPHKCPISDCEFSTARLRCLTSHMDCKHQTSGRVFVCDRTGCEYRTSVSKYYRSHMRNKH